MKRLLGSLLLASLMVSKAWAQTPPPPDPWNTPHPAPPPGQPPPPPYAPPPQAPPPPPYGAPNPYGGWGSSPYGFSQQAVFMYENEKKNAGIALLINFLLPGLGSIYADHAMGALLTWGLIFGGVAVAVWGINQGAQNGSGTINPAPILVGYLMAISGVVYSYIDAYASTKAYNRALAQRLGLPAGFSLGPAPLLVDGQSTAWGPALSFRF
jgi:hypothetical protein